MSPLTEKEARLLTRLERGLGLRLLAGPVVGAVGGMLFAAFLVGSAPAGRFTLGDQSPAYARFEQAVGPQAAFVLLCAIVFAGLGVFLSLVLALGLTRVRSQLRARRDTASVMTTGAR